MVGRDCSELPPGFRFHPTDEELIMCYLRNQITSTPCPVAIIPEVDIYKFDPWELPERSEFGENEWYFFTPRDRKYPNGVRPNRAAVSGYWKATGTDKAIYSGSRYVGVKKALVFYKGKPPKGVKTEWIMHEYRWNESRMLQSKQNGSMRTLQKEERSKDKLFDQRAENLPTETLNSIQTQLLKLPRTCSLIYLWDYGYTNSISQLLPENSYSLSFHDQEIVSNNNNNNNMSTLNSRDFEKNQQVQHCPYTSGATKIEGNGRPLLVNPTYELG